MNEEKRMAENYEITQSIKISGKEVVFGEDERADNPYFCAFYTSNAILGEYSECMVGDDYVEMMEMFAERIKEQCNKHRAEQAKITVPIEQITADMCHHINDTGSLKNKVAAVKTSALCPEYRTATHQLVYVTGGNGARANSFGNACYCKNLYSGKSVRWERYDIQGEVKPEHLPEWAKERLVAIQKEQQTKGESEPKKEKEEKER